MNAWTAAEPGCVAFLSKYPVLVTDQLQTSIQMRNLTLRANKVSAAAVSAQVLLLATVAIQSCYAQSQVL
jgi:hypothetical protein